LLSMPIASHVARCQLDKTDQRTSGGCREQPNNDLLEREKFWLGKLREHPENMTQGRILKELEANLRDAYRMNLLRDMTEEYCEKAIAA